MWGVCGETPSSCEIIRHMPVGTTMKSHYAPLRTREKNCCSVPQSCLTLCDPMDCSTPGFPVLHHLPELAQTRVHRVSDAILPSHPLLSPSPPAFSLSQHQGQLFPSGGRSIGASASAQVLQMNIQD